jgi:hypothetical protein
MALNSYGDLQAQLGNWLARSDLSMYYDDFIRLAEIGFARRLFRIRQQEMTTNILPVSGTAPLPSDYLAYRRLTWTGSPRIQLEYVHPVILQATYPTQPADIPRIFTVEGNNVLVRPVDDTPLEIVYTARNPALIQQLNSLYADFPDIYLHGALVEAFSFTKDTNAAAYWKERLQESETEYKLNTFNHAGVMQVRVFGFTP